MKSVVVVGASTKIDRISNKAAKRLIESGYFVQLFGLEKNAQIAGVPIQTDWSMLQKPIDTITLYLNPIRQKPLYSNILALQPKRIIFNPGTENPELETLAEESKIQVIEACTLVMLSTGQF
ncbi:MAG: CoA-binding protein [Bacteroidia bacterium]|nr:CoA-binding protein [Bacteroidia bacterium]